MEKSINQVFAKAIKAHQEDRLTEAEHLYEEVLEIETTHLESSHNLGVIRLLKNDIEGAIILFKKTISIKPDYAEAYSNLGVSFERLSRFEEAGKSYKKAIDLKQNYVEAYFNLGNICKILKKLDEAEASYKKAINIKPDYAEVHNNLGTILEELDRLDEAEASFKKAIEIKPKYFQAYNNLGNILKKKDKFDEAEKNYKKAIELKPDYEEAVSNLELVSNQKELLSKITKEKNSSENKEILDGTDSDKRLTSNPFITHRDVELELINCLYKINSKKIEDVPSFKKGLLFGSGKRSNDFQLFEQMHKEKFSIIETVEKDLINIMSKAVKSEVIIIDSFFHILGGDSLQHGTKPHHHITTFDETNDLIKRKFSLTYYLSVGDQTTSEPGYLKFKDPVEEILPSKGMITIFPSNRLHWAVYNGKADRVIIGINFYGIS